MAAAASAAQQGGRVLLLEKQPHLGGTTGIAVGSFTAAGTRWQQARNIADTLDDHADDAGKFASPVIEACNNSELRAFFLDHAAETLDWLESLDIKFIGPSREPPNRVPRMHNAVPNAKAYIAALQLELARRGGTILTSVAVTDLLHEKGRGGGVRVAAARGRLYLTGQLRFQYPCHGRQFVILLMRSSKSALGFVKAEVAGGKRGDGSSRFGNLVED